MKLRAGAHIHIMGICGTAMASIAGMLQALGYRVTGSDQNVYPPMSTLLEQLGIPIKQGYRKENLTPRPDLVIVGNVMSEKAEESQALLASDIPRMSFPQALAEFVIADRKSLVVAGTHGKTTTTAMLAWIANYCSVDPGFLVGGIPKNFSRSFQVPKGDIFVVEGDEYETAFFDKGSKFMHYRPYGVILHRVELDHIEYFKTFERVKEAFAKFLRIIPEQGILLMFAEEKANQELLREAKCQRKYSFGFTEGDFRATNLRFDGIRVEFDVLFQENKLDRVQIDTFGNYNVLNALAAYAMGYLLQWDRARILQALASFSGVKRRQEVIGNPRGIMVIEDFAHHPTAVAQTVESIKSRFPKNRVFAIFEPRSATSCRKVFQVPYFESLQKADTAIIVPPNAFREVPLEEQLNPERLVTDLQAAGVDAHSIRAVDDVVQFTARSAVPGDIVLIMSNGAFGGIYQKMLAALAKES